MATNYSILESVEGLNSVIRALQKIDCMQRSGHFIDAHRAVNSLIAGLDNNKKELIEKEKEKEEGKNNV
jgi:hypothetical protein